MARRTTIGDDPLDAVIPPLEEGTGKGRGERRSGGEPAPDGGDLPPPPPAQRPERPRPAPGDRPATERRERPAGPHQYLTFTAAGEEFALDILRIREILQLAAITRVPLTPPWVRGVMNLRGSVLPVIDLAAKLDLPAASPGPRSCVVIVEVSPWGEELVLGLLVDAVEQVLELTDEELEEPPAFGTRVHLDYLGAMGRVGERFVLLLDIDRVLSEEELRMAAALEEPESPAGAAAGDGAA